MSKPILVLMGPTAVGKTDLSLALAEEIDAEIISVDSRQIYRGLDIGTAKPEPQELARIRHHFIDELDLTEHLSAGHFAAIALRRIADIYARARVPLVIGGSTLYLAALLHGISDIPSISPEVRDMLKERLGREGPAMLYEELQRLDPESARTMDPTKSQRIVRALEVYYGTGKTLSSYHSTAARKPGYDFIPVVLTRDREALYRRINLRVDHMIEQGLLREVEGILKKGYQVEALPLRTIGYREIIRSLRGQIPLDEAIRLIKRNTRRYAKRQLTWFRRFPEYQWLKMDDREAVIRKCVFYLQ